MWHEVTVLWICGIICVAMIYKKSRMMYGGIGAYEFSSVARFDIYYLHKYVAKVWFIVGITG